MSSIRPAGCEHRDDGEPACSARARFRVSRGRKYDAQDSCGRHLAATVVALTGVADVTVTVERIWETADPAEEQQR